MNFYQAQNFWYLLLLIPFAVFAYSLYPSRLRALRHILGKNFDVQMRFAFSIYYTASSFLFGLALVSLIIAMTQPLWGGNNQLKQRREELQINFVLDISRSMLAKDLEPSRMERAVSLLQSLYLAFPYEEQSLVIFKGRAQTLIPPTKDHSVFQNLFPYLGPEMLNSPGSNIAAAMEEAMSHSHSLSNVKPVIILLSDGEDLSAQIDGLLPKLDNWDGAIISVGFGSRKGTNIYDKNGNLIFDNAGLPVETKLDEQVLKLISSRGKGRYFNATDFNLKGKIISELQPLHYSNNIASYNLQDQSEFFIIFSLLCLFLLAVLRRIGFTGVNKILQRQERS